MYIGNVFVIARIPNQSPFFSSLTPTLFIFLILQTLTALVLGQEKILDWFIKEKFNSNITHDEKSKQKLKPKNQSAVLACMSSMLFLS